MIIKTIKCALATLLILELYNPAIKHDLILWFLFPCAVYFSLDALLNKRYIFSAAYILTSFIYNSIQPVSLTAESWILINSATSILFFSDICSWCLSLLKNTNESQIERNFLVPETNDTTSFALSIKASNDLRESQLNNLSATYAEKFHEELKQKTNELLASKIRTTIEGSIQEYFSNQSLEEKVQEEILSKSNLIKELVNDKTKGLVSEMIHEQNTEKIISNDLENIRENIPGIIDNELSKISGSIKTEIKLKTAELAKVSATECFNDFPLENFVREYVENEVKSKVNEQIQNEIRNRNIFGDLSENRLIKEGVFTKNDSAYPSKETRELINKALFFNSENKPQEAEKLIRKALLLWDREKADTEEKDPVSVTVKKPGKLNFEALDALFLDKEPDEIIQNNCSNRTKPSTFCWPPRKSKRA